MAAEVGEANDLRAELRLLVGAIEASGRSVVPGSSDELLQSIVGAAAQIFGAAAASIAMVDEITGELEFRVAYGAGQQEVVGTRIPFNKGIAGYVAMTGQPIAISNVREDARFNRDFAQSTGYIPVSILATPLLSEGHVIGVMEVLDKLKADSFGMQDMELLGVFAHQAAIAIGQARKIEWLGTAVLEELKSIANADGGEFLKVGDLFAGLEVERVREVDEVKMITLLFREIQTWGDPERAALLRIIAAFVDYVRSKP